ncbi:hypothetical protein GCM10009753_45380 [Streptantibioticus ferralitis]
MVVGAGSAGMTCAWKPSEDPGNEVVLVEGGADPGPGVPDILRQEIGLPPDYYWNHTGADTGDFLPCGRVFGGSSAVNAAEAQRGRPWCYDAWGSPERTWQKCLPAFCALEADQQFGEAEHHGADGPIPVTRYAPQPCRQRPDQHPPGAGNFGTPEILFRSGIGPAEHLRASELPVMVDAPELGSHLSDHALVQMDVTDPLQLAMPGEWERCRPSRWTATTTRRPSSSRTARTSSSHRPDR